MCERRYKGMGVAETSNRDKLKVKGKKMKMMMTMRYSKYF